jgi:hypothetical protein
MSKNIKTGFQRLARPEPLFSEELLPQVCLPIIFAPIFAAPKR